MEHYLRDKPLEEIILVLSIVQIVRQRQRSLPAGRGVLPKSISAWFDDYRCEQTLRRDCAKLARAGLLVRVGGTNGTRKGYRVAA